MSQAHAVLRGLTGAACRQRFDDHYPPRLCACGIRTESISDYFNFLEDEADYD